MEQEISDRYGLPLNDGLIDLLNLLREYGTRDLLPGRTPGHILKQRRKAFTDAKAISKTAHAMNLKLSQLCNRISQFSADYEFNPELMTSVFDVEMGPPSELRTPTELESLVPRNAERLRDDIRSLLKPLLDLPVKAQKDPARIPHPTLLAVVTACREYWCKSGRCWRMVTLQDALEGDEVSVLTDECERFVADALGATGFPFTLLELRRAWQRLTRVKGANPD